MGGLRGQHVVLLLAAALAATLLCLAELMLRIDVDVNSAAHQRLAPRRANQRRVARRPTLRAERNRFEHFLKPA